MQFDRNSLQPFNSGKDERVGLVLKDGTIIELKNICQDPENGFEIDGADFLQYENDVAATWHTHPGTTCNLTMEDHNFFLNYPTLDHYIVGNDGVARYYVEKGKVLRCDGASTSTAT